MPQTHRERPRFSVDVSGDERDRIERALPWGMRNLVIKAAVMQIVEVIEKEGQIVAYLIANGRLRVLAPLEPSTRTIMGVQNADTRTDEATSSKIPEGDDTR